MKRSNNEGVSLRDRGGKDEPPDDIDDGEKYVQIPHLAAGCCAVPAASRISSSRLLVSFDRCQAMTTTNASIWLQRNGCCAATQARAISGSRLSFASGDPKHPYSFNES
jgi:hypothetical protein